MISRLGLMKVCTPQIIFTLWFSGGECKPKSHKKLRSLNEFTESGNKSGRLDKINKNCSTGDRSSNLLYNQACRIAFPLLPTKTAVFFEPFSLVNVWTEQKRRFASPIRRKHKQ